MLRKIEPITIYIIGHADSEPYAKKSKNSNGKLSLERANSVAEELRKTNRHVDIRVIGISDGFSAVSEVKNDIASTRRVDIFLVGSDQILDWFSN